MRDGRRDRRLEGRMNGVAVGGGGVVIFQGKPFQNCWEFSYPMFNDLLVCLEKLTDI